MPVPSVNVVEFLAVLRVSSPSKKVGRLVISSKSNGGDSGNVLKILDAWVIREQPAVVYFNCGIHDTKEFIAIRKFQIVPEMYEANLRSIVHVSAKKRTP
ncbi:MAG: hypothetical protein O3B86_19625 [Planctomycetota bacterium]|nr:hypothetical protein [Planctomycetota bacterium]